jgi:hypothetical protein
MDNLPSLDNQELRKKQFIRYTEGLGELGDYAKELKKSTKISNYLGILYTFVFLSFILFVIIYQYSHGGISSLIDTSYIVRRFNCTNNEYSDILRSYEDVKIFLEIYGGECKLYKIGD